MSQTTLELPESDGAAPAEPRPTRVNDAPDDGKGLEFHFAELREVLGEYNVNHAEGYLQSIVQCLRRDLHEPSPAGADKHDYEEELCRKLARIKHIAASLRNTVSEGDKTSLDEVRSLALTIEEMAEPLPEICEDLMDELGDVKQALRLARVDSYNPPPYPKRPSPRTPTTRRRTVRQWRESPPRTTQTRQGIQSSESTMISRGRSQTSVPD